MKTALFFLGTFLFPLFIQSQQTTEVIKEEFSAWVLNTDFNLPAIRFNTFEINEKSGSSSLGRLSVFNSVGAGISINNGLFAELRDASNADNVLNTQMRNRFGVHLGMLFSYPNDSLKSFVFAPTFGLQILDIQFGMGYELGTILSGENRLFYTLAYRIHLKKLYNLSYIRMAQKKKQKVSKA